MNLKKRLMISNLSLLAIPPVVTALLAVLVYLIIGAWSGSSISYNNFEQAVRIRFDLFAAAESIWKESPDTVAKTSFAQYLSTRLGDIQAEIVVARDSTLIFSTPGINPAEIEPYLNPEDPVAVRTVIFENITYQMHSHRFSHTDGTPGIILLLAPVDRSVMTAGAFAIFVMLTLLISSLAVSIIYSVRIFRNIASPLVKLNETVTQISQGDLNQEIIEHGDEEIRQLLRSLELMRLKLLESVRLQDEQEEARQLLVSNISHDLKTPVTSIKGYVEGIIDGVAGTPEKQRRYLETIYAKAIQIDRMIDDLLFFSRLERAQVSYNFVRTDPIRFFNDYLAENREEFAGCQMTLIMENHLAGNRIVLMDHDKMKRVMQNIFDNARKYRKGSSGSITMVLRETAERLIVEIRDFGIGIPKQSLPHVFDRFYRADSARTTADGSGLGLSIARQILKDHEGDLWIRSQENEGTSVMLSLKKEQMEET